MATLTSTKIKNTYDALLKASDNDSIGSSAKQITDGLGNGTPLYISTTQIGIGVTPEASYDLHVYSNAKVGGNLTVTGDLTVEGTTTTIDTQTLTVEDPLIEVASNNTSTDAVDIGWYGKYAPSGTVLYAGLFRDTGDGKFKLFKSLEDAPTTTVNTSGTGYTRADLIIGNLEATQVDLGDDEKIRLGNSQDLEIYHNSATNQSFIRINGELELRANTLQLKNYAGETYFRGTSNGAVRLYYDGSEKFITTSTGISVTDTVSATTFSGQLDGTISSTTTATTQSQGDNSTKVATTAYVDSAIGDNDTLAEILANGNTTGGTDISVSAGDDILLTDTSELKLGTDADFKIYHNNTNGYIQNYTGHLYIENLADDKDIKFISDNGSGGTQVYFELQGVSGGTNPFTVFPDSSFLVFGSGHDLQIYHDSANSYIDNKTGSLLIRNTNDNYHVIIQSDNGGGGLADYFRAKGDTGEAILYHYGNQKFKTTSSGVTVTGDINITGDTITTSNSDDYLEFDDDTTTFNPDSNTTTLTSVSGIALATNLNDGGGGTFTVATGSTGTRLLTIDTSGVTTFINNININGNNKHIRFVDTYGNWMIEAGDGANNFKIHSQSLAADYLTLEGGGQLNLGEYGSGSFTGTATYRLAVDSSGDVIEIPIGDGAVDGSGTANTVTMWSDTDTITDAPITISGNNSTFAGNINTGKDKYLRFTGESSGSDAAILFGNSAGTGGSLTFKRNSDSSAILRLDADGNVGIGTSSPNKKLEILSTASDHLRLAYNSSAYWDLFQNAGDGSFRILKDNGSLFTFAQSENLGIGTTTPQQSIHIVNTDGANIILNSNTGAENNGIWMTEGAVASPYTNGAYVHYDSANNAFKINTGSSTLTTRLTIARDTGNVGIGTSTIARGPLHVHEGSTGYSQVHLTNSSSGSTSNDGLTLFTNGNDAGIMQRENSYLLFGTNDTERMRITSGGQLKLGTGAYTSIQFDPDPASHSGNGGLDIEPLTSPGSGTANWYTRFKNRVGGGTTNHNVTIDGSVGIGTTSPAVRLDVNAGNSDTIARFESADNRGRIQIDDNDTTVYAIAEGSKMSLGTSNTLSSTNLTIDSSGKVGISQTSPIAKLHVSGTGNQGVQAWFGNGFVNNASYHYDFARIGFSTESTTGTDTGAGFHFNTRNSGNNNWMHGYIYQPQNGGISFGYRWSRNDICY